MVDSFSSWILFQVYSTCAKNSEKKRKKKHTHLASNPLPSSLSPPFSLSHTYLLSFHYIASLPSFPLCLRPPASLSPYQVVTEWFRSTARSHSAKGHERLVPFLESACHCLISSNSLIPSFAGGSSGVGRRRHSLMLLSLLQRILLSPWLSVKGVLPGNFSQARLKSSSVKCAALPQ